MNDLAALPSCVACPTLLPKLEAGSKVVPAQVGRGYRKGGIAVLLEAPGFYEAQRGVPLTGKKQALFNDLVEAAGLAPSDLLVTHTVRHQVPNGRVKDYPEVVFACGDWTALEFAVHEPSVVVVMGATALKTVFGAEASVGATRGVKRELPPKHAWGQRTVLATYHYNAASFEGGVTSEVGQHIVADLRAARVAWEVLQDG